MPAGTDLITWKPRVGDTGDDRYDPGDTVIKVGALSTAYSTLPTLDEVNAGDGLNQIAAEIRRRLWSGDYNRPGSYSGVTPPGYMDAWIGTKMLTGGIGSSGWKNPIDSIRSAERSSAYSWPTFPSTSVVGLRAAVLALRKALATDHVQLWRWAADSSAAIENYCNPYPTSSSKALNAGLGYAGEIKVSSTRGYKYRSYSCFRIPATLPASMAADLRFLYRRYASYTDVTNIYKSSSHLGPIDTGDWGNLDSLVFSATNTSFCPVSGVDTWVDLNLSGAWYGGSNYTLIMAMSNEIADTGPYNGRDQHYVGSTTQPRLMLYLP